MDRKIVRFIDIELLVVDLAHVLRVRRFFDVLFFVAIICHFHEAKTTFITRYFDILMAYRFDPFTSLFNGGQGNQFQTPPPESQYSQSTHSTIPPASKRVLENLTKTLVTPEDLTNDETKDCVICLEEFTSGEEVVKLTCGHLFHEECILGWLKINCTCPMCRLELGFKN